MPRFPSSSSSSPYPRRRLALLAMLLPLLALFMPACRPTTGKAFAELRYPEPVAETRTMKVGEVTGA